MRNSKRKETRRKEQEDAIGIKRGKVAKALISIKIYKIIKICLIIALPIAYFVFSPLLIAVALGWVGLLFITNSIEKNYNDGLKSEMCTRLPKADSIIALLIIIIALISVGVSSFSFSTKVGRFDGMTDTQIEEILENSNVSEFDLTLRRVGMKIKDFSTLGTGTRYLFASERAFMGGPGGMMGREPPEGFTPPTTRPDVSEIMKNMPFSMLFESIVRAMNSALLVVLGVLGVLSLLKLKKLNLSDETLSVNHRKRLLKSQEEQRQKENEKKNFITVKKADFTDLERELIDDLAFLFDEEETET